MKKDVIVLLQKLGYNIKVRDYCRPNGQATLYIEEIEGIKYRVCDQNKARKHIEEIIQEVSNG